VFERVYDVGIIGGGLTGASIARDAAGRGLSVLLCEEGDLGGRASSATNRLVHGGLDHLGRLEIGALRLGLVESAILRRAAPYLVRPLRFVLPHHDQLWPRWALRLGLRAYDRLARRPLPPYARLNLEGDDMEPALHAHFRAGFALSDCMADDARLVIAHAVDARQRGASINPRVRCVVAERERERWRLSLETASGKWMVAHVAILINATGAEVASVLDHVVHTNRSIPVTLTRHSQIVVRRPNDDGAYALPAGDGRIVYAMPHAPGFMLLGSAEAPHRRAPTEAYVEPADVGYLADVANQYFDRPIVPGDIAQRLGCVTAMPVDRESVSGDHAVVVETAPGGAPLLSVFRRMAEEVVDRLARFRKVGEPWTANALLPGGNFSGDVGIAELSHALRVAYPFVGEDHALRLVTTYGTRAPAILVGARRTEDLGICFGADLTEAEVNFLRHEEWAMEAEDVLWRRTRLGLRFTAGQAQALATWMAETARQPVPA
jgi:glycerol-3-phosphate dehydrogenase